MATKKDLVEAYSFSRRRLVTAFVSGAPGGREVEPSRPGRTVIGGAALAILLVAAAAVLGILKSRTDVDWDQAAVISDSDTGADYIITGPDQPLRQIVNITSALLLLGPDLERIDVPGEEIATRQRSGTIGILGAPTTPPSADQLVQTGWTACTGTSDFTDRAEGVFGVKLDLAETTTTTPTPDVGYVVTVGSGRGERTFLIAEATPPGGTAPRAYAYLIPRKETKVGSVLTLAASSSTEDALPVEQDYLDLFTPGAPLQLSSFGVAPGDFGKRPGYADDASLAGQRAKIGDLLTFEGTTYLLTTDGGVVLSPFALAVWQSLSYPGGATSSTREATVSPDFPTTGLGADGSVVWPQEPTTAKAGGEFCGRLDVGPGRDPGVRLVETQGGEGDDASAADVEPGASDTAVDPGHGAVVTAGDWDAEGAGQQILVDDSGTAFDLVGDAHDQLGYADIEAVVVPDSWLYYFEDGVELSVADAMCPPTSTPRAEPC